MQKSLTLHVWLKVNRNYLLTWVYEHTDRSYNCFCRDKRALLNVDVLFDE